MPSKITMALAAAAIAFATSAYAARSHIRDNESASEPAQYCVPQYDSSGAQRPPYC